jgi:chloramphenicol 3-O phosphotransferase
MPGRVVILNGAPRSGKTSIARALQDRPGGLWINLGVDAAIAMTPAHLRPGIGLRPGAQRPDLEPFVLRQYAALFAAIAIHAEAGLDVAADFGIHDGYSRPLRIWDILEATFADLPVLTVGVLCPADVIAERRAIRPVAGFGGEDPSPLIATWQREVHLGHDYGLTLDTTVKSPGECAETILQLLSTLAR